jgi:predicted acyltransferase
MSSIPAKTNRILSLDVFRGLTIVLMILVNSPGTRTPYPILEHASWNGCTLADIVFPCFLFIVGLSSTISLKKQAHQKTKFALYSGIIQRSVILFFVGVLLNAIPYHFNFETIRVYGILQRIAVCYLVCAILYLNTTTKAQILIFLGILLGYWFIMTQIPVPGHGANQLTVEGSWVTYFDQMLFTPAHLFEKVYDPEGFLSTLPAIATTLAGLLTGRLLLTSLSNKNKCYLMSIMGCVFLLLGWLWGFSFPINKNLWTSSFVLWTGGYALIVFALSFLIIDILGYTKWALPLKIFGMNALFAFILHVALLKIQSMFYFPLRNGNLDNLRAVVADHLFGSYGAQNAALFYSIVFLFLNFLVVAFLYRYKIFIRI